MIRMGWVVRVITMIMVIMGWVGLGCKSSGEKQLAKLASSSTPAVTFQKGDKNCHRQATREHKLSQTWGEKIVTDIIIIVVVVVHAVDVC